MVPIAGDRHALQVFQQRVAVVPGHRTAAVNDVVALERAHRDEAHALEPERREERGELLANTIEDVLAVAFQVHLVDAHEQVRNAQQRSDVGVAAGLLQHAEPRVDQDDGDVGRGRAGRHVARVLHVPGRVGDDELALGSRKVAVRNVDRDALFALRLEAIGEQRKVDLHARATRRSLHRGQLVFVDAVRIVQKTTDQRGFAVIDRAHGDEAKQLLLLVLLEIAKNIVGDLVLFSRHRNLCKWLWGFGVGHQTPGWGPR